MLRLPLAVLIVPLSVSILSAGSALASIAGDDLDRCYLRVLKGSADEVTVAELKAVCDTTPSTEDAVQAASDATPAPAGATQAPTGATFTQQIAAERQSLDRSYSLTPHLPNYLLAYSLRNNPNTPNMAGSQGELDKQEAVLQISVKFPLWRRILGSENDLLFSYTSKSWFQAYNSALSKPFRETNYEPEIFFRNYGGQQLPAGIRLAGWDFGYNHQSNGRSEPLSRSWDRLMGRLALDVTPNLSMVVRAWYRIPESEATDDNPGIHQYMGYGDFRAVWTPNRNTFTAMIRPGTRENGFEFSWSYPINKHIRIFTQYYYGYGESLIDYDQKVERIGIGFAINDYLQAQ